MQTSKGDGMVLMDVSIRNLVERGLVGRERAMEVTNNPRLFDE